jgi:uncharacterized protein
MPAKEPIVALSADTIDNLPPAPIDPSWILEGHPVANARQWDLPYSRTLNATIWECTSGRFDWHYGGDEIIHIVAGEAELTFEDGSVRRVRPGDMVYFPGAQTARWYVPTYVRKIAIGTLRVSPVRRLAQRIPGARRIVHMARARMLTL